MTTAVTAPGKAAGRGDHKLDMQPLTGFRLATGYVRMRPDFIIIGAQKAGTSSLYRYLAEHPAVEPNIGKEVHYFDWNYHRGERWYRAHFPTTIGSVITRARTGTKILTGEASPYYMFHPLAPGRVKALLPTVKLIALLRDPVARALSAHEHQSARGNETLPFAEAIDQEPARLAGEAERIRQDGRYRSYAHRHYSYLARGVYADQLEAWLHVFPREQILVIRSEDFFENPAATYAEVLSFLGLPSWQPGGFRRFNSGQYAGMNPELQRRLVAYFAPHNERLYRLLGRDFGWPR